MVSGDQLDQDSKGGMIGPGNDLKTGSVSNRQHCMRWEIGDCEQRLIANARPLWKIPSDRSKA